MNTVRVYGKGIIIRIVILLIISIGFGLVFMSDEWIFSQIVLLILIVLIAIEIIRYIYKTNTEINRFLDTLKYSEFSSSFASSKMPKRYSDLQQKMEEIKLDYEKRALDQELKSQNYQRILQIFDAGILLLNKNKNIILKSPKINEMLGMSTGSNLDDIERSFPNLINQIYDSGDQAKWVLRKEEHNHLFEKDLSCEVHKYKIGDESQILVILSVWDGDASGATFETWVNFSKVISHEILNGISPLIALTGTMKDQVQKIEGNDKVKDSMKKALDIIEERTTSLRTYSERYRTLNKLPEPQKENVIWEDIISKVVSDNNERIHADKIQVQIDGDAIDGVLKADRWQLDQVFTNLLLNSINALKDVDRKNKTINIHIDDNKFNYIITWKDNGIGIDKNNRAKVFMPFFTTRNDGSGIGLSVVKQILWKHNADIFLSENEPGASFVLRFPKL